MPARHGQSLTGTASELQRPSVTPSYATQLEMTLAKAATTAVLGIYTYYRVSHTRRDRLARSIDYSGLPVSLPSCHCSAPDSCMFWEPPN